MACLVGGLAGCAANPGPPPVVDNDQQAHETTETTPTQEKKSDPVVDRATVSVGVDPLPSGLNPHLVANNSELVEQIADLVLPSPFKNGAMDTDVLVAAQEQTPPAGLAQRVRYEISGSAQWSDGTPITGADFSYLWQQMVSTSGVVAPAGYHAISAVTSSDGGRIVTVDFAERVADWQGLFRHLLPSHLLQGQVDNFAEALSAGIPASAGRYLVDNVDRARGVITLNRNDRFWGANPAKIDVLQLRYIRSTDQGVNMLRTGQIAFADFTPGQITMESLRLLSDVTSTTVTRPRQLRAHLVTTPGTMTDVEARRDFASLIDTAQLSRLATGRDTDLRPAVNPVAPGRDLSALRRLTERRPLRIAVDPTHTQAQAAANVMVDVLASHDIPAEVVTERMTTITSQLLPESGVDVVLAWEDTSESSINLADTYLCNAESTADSNAETSPTQGDEPDRTSSQAPAPESKPSQTGNTSNDKPLPWAGDLSGYCPAESDQTRTKILSGELPVTEASKRVHELNSDRVLFVPILDETRVHAVGRGIVGPGNNIEDWEGGLVTAPEWTMSDN